MLPTRPAVAILAPCAAPACSSASCSSPSRAVDDPADIYITRDAFDQGEHHGRLVCAVFVNDPGFVEITVHPEDMLLAVFLDYVDGSVLGTAEYIVN